MKTPRTSTKELLKSIRKSAQEEVFDPASDLALLAAQFKTLPKREFGLVLEQMEKKYRESEAAAVRAALVAKAIAGDLDAIRMYREQKAQLESEDSGKGVVIIDDI